MPRPCNTKGFTLIELIIAAILSTVVITAALGIYMVQHKHLIVQDQISDMQQNVRASLQDLSTKIRLAGYNVPTGLSALNAYDTNPDSLEILYDSGRIQDVYLVEDMATSSSELRCDGLDLSLIHQGDTIFIYDPITQVGEYLVLSEVHDSSGHLRPNTLDLLIPYPAGSLIMMMETIKYYIDNTSDPQHPRLMVQVNGGLPQIYADNIADLQFQYVLSSGAIVDVPTLAKMVREVIIDITARTDSPDEDLGDEYRTRHLRTSVKVRNLGIN